MERTIVENGVSNKEDLQIVLLEEEDGDMGDKNDYDLLLDSDILHIGKEKPCRGKTVGVNVNASLFVQGGQYFVEMEEMDVVVYEEENTK